MSTLFLHTHKLRPRSDVCKLSVHSARYFGKILYKYFTFTSLNINKVTHTTLGSIRNNS